MEKITFRDEYTGMEFIFVRGGRFILGDQFGDGFPDEYPVVEVEVGDFYLGTLPVTQGQWRHVMDSNPSMFKKGDDYPVEMVSWESAKELTRRMNENSPNGFGFRLPTELEWEFAARAGGKKHKWSGTSDLEELGDYAWYEDNSNFRTHPVGQKKPNELGFHEMSGSTHEWNEEFYFTDALAALAQGGTIPETGGSHRSFRGGSWKRHAEGLRCTRRMGGRPNEGFGTYGVRIAMDVPKT